jgi:hypothetical protein
LRGKRTDEVQFFLLKRLKKKQNCHIGVRGQTVGVHHCGAGVGGVVFDLASSRASSLPQRFAV